MAVESARLNRLLAAAPLILALSLLSVLPHRHAVVASDVSSVSGTRVHGPHSSPCLEAGATPGSHVPCASCCFQRLLSGGEIATSACSAPAFLSARMPAPPRVVARSSREGIADPRGPPVV